MTKVAVCQSCFRVVLSLPLLSSVSRGRTPVQHYFSYLEVESPFFDKASLELKFFQFEFSIA